MSIVYQLTIIATWIGYIGLFALGLMLAVRRSERGFKVIPIATGIWIITWAMGGSKLGFLLFPLGLLIFIFALVDVLRSEN